MATPMIIREQHRLISPTWTEVCESLSLSEGCNGITSAYELARQALWSKDYAKSVILFSVALLKLRNHKQSQSREPSSSARSKSFDNSDPRYVAIPGERSQKGARTINSYVELLQQQFLTTGSSDLIDKMPSGSQYQIVEENGGTQLDTSDNSVFKEYLSLAVAYLGQVEIDEEKKDDLKQAISIIISQCNGCSDIDTAILTGAASVHLRMECHGEALRLASQAVERNPHSLIAFETFENMCCHLVERWHFIMLNDRSRNFAYKQSLTKSIDENGPGTTVCDVGCGTGLLSLISASHPNCGHVYAIEKSSTMCDIARSILSSGDVPTNISQKVSVINEMSSDMSVPNDMPERVDILVTETFDAGVFGEGILPTLCHAWNNLLKNQSPSVRGQVIPGKASLYVIAVESEDIRVHSRFINKGEFFNLDLKNVEMCSNMGMCTLDPYTTFDLSNLSKGYKALSAPVRFMGVDFNDPEEVASLSRGSSDQFHLEVSQAGRLDALVAWFTLHLSDTSEISTHPDSPGCWEQAVFPVSIARIAHRAGARDPEALLDVSVGDQLTVVRKVKGSRLCMAVSDINREFDHKPESSERHSDIPVMIKDLRYWIRHGSYTLESRELSNLNDRNLQRVLCDRVKELADEAPHACFIHMNSGFSPMCLEALKLGFCQAIAIAPTLIHQELFAKLVSDNNINPFKLNLMEDVNDLIETDTLAELGRKMSSSTSSSSSSLQRTNFNRAGFDRQSGSAAVVLCDVMDFEGRVVESLVEQLSVLQYSLSNFSTIIPIPHHVEIFGVLVDSDELLQHSRIQSDNNTLGFCIGKFINKFATRNHQGIVTQMLQHTKLSAPFKMFSIDLGRLLGSSLLTPSSQCNKEYVKQSQGEEEPAGKKLHSETTFEARSESRTMWPHTSTVTDTSDSSIPFSASVFTHAVPLETSESHTHVFTSQDSLIRSHADLIQTPPSNKEDGSRSSLLGHDFHVPEKSDRVRKCAATSQSVAHDVTLSDVSWPNKSLPKTSACNTLPESVGRDADDDGPQKKRMRGLCLENEPIPSIVETAKRRQSENELEQSIEMKIPVVESGKVSALVYWFHQHISPSQQVSTINPEHHWQQAAVMVGQSVYPMVSVGDVLSIHCRLSHSAITFSVDSKDK